MAAGAWASCVGEAFLVGGTCRRSPCSHYYTRVSPPTGHPSPEGGGAIPEPPGVDTRRRTAVWRGFSNSVASEFQVGAPWAFALSFHAMQSWSHRADAEARRRRLGYAGVSYPYGGSVRNLHHQSLLMTPATTTGFVSGIIRQT